MVRQQLRQCFHILQVEKKLQVEWRQLGERLVGRGEEGERAFPSSVATRLAALRAVTSVERSGVATARFTMVLGGIGTVDDVHHAVGGVIVP